MSTDVATQDRQKPSTESARAAGTPTSAVDRHGPGTRAVASMADGYDAQMALLRPVQAKQDPASGGGALRAGGGGQPQTSDVATTGAGKEGGTEAVTTAEDAPKKHVGGRGLDEIAARIPPVGQGETGRLREDSGGIRAWLNEQAFSRWLFDDALAALAGHRMTLVSEGGEAKRIQIDRFRQLLQSPVWADRFRDAPVAGSPAQWDNYTEGQLSKEGGKLARLKVALKWADRAMGALGVVGGALNVANGFDALNAGSTHNDKANAVMTIVQGVGGIAAGILAIAGSSLAAPVGLGVAALQLRSRGAQLTKAWLGVEAFGMGESVASDGGAFDIAMGTFVTAAGLVMEAAIGAVATVIDLGIALYSGGMSIAEWVMKLFGEYEPAPPPDEPGLPPEVLAPHRPEDAGPDTPAKDDKAPRKDAYRDTERKLPVAGRRG